MRASLVILLIVAATLLPSCAPPAPSAPPLQNALVGKWRQEDGNRETLEFFKDGTVTAVKRDSDGTVELVGTYAAVADDRVKFEYKGRDPFLATTAITGDKLKLTYADEKYGHYKRVR